MNKLKYVLYARKSQESDDRQVQSIEAQIREMTEYAKKINIEIVEVIHESKSAKTPNLRHGFNRMMQLINEKHVNAILVWHPNRLARNHEEGGKLVHLLNTGEILEIRTNNSVFSSSDNSLILAIEFGMSTEYSRTLSKDVKRGSKLKVEKGGIIGYVPLGYINDRNTRQAILDTKRANIIKKAFELFITGNYSVGKLTKILNEQYILRTRQNKKIAKSTLHAILRNPFYYGIINYNGTSYKGIHPTLITKAQFEKTQMILKREFKTGKIQKHSFNYTNLIVCGECGSIVTAEHRTKIQKNGNIHYYIYYHCAKTKKVKIRCSQKLIQEKLLESQLIDFLKIIDLTENFKKFVIKWIKYVNEYERNSEKDRTKQQERYLKSLKERSSKLLNLLLDGSISNEKYKQEQEAMDKQIEEAEKVLKELLENSKNIVNKAENTLGLAVKIIERLKKLGANEKKEMLNKICSNLLLKDNKLNCEAKIPFVIAKEAQEELFRHFEPNETLFDKAKNTPLTKERPVWFGR